MMNTTDSKLVLHSSARVNCVPLGVPPRAQYRSISEMYKQAGVFILVAHSLTMTLLCRRSWRVSKCVGLFAVVSRVASGVYSVDITNKTDAGCPARHINMRIIGNCT
jgi:hypothetical protein